MTSPALLAATIGLAALTACGTSAPPPPPPELSICARTADGVRVPDTDCAPGSPALAAGAVRWLDADPECLDADDRTEVGAVADDDYLEGCDEDGHAKVRKPAPKSSAKTTTRKAPPTTTRKKVPT